MKAKLKVSNETLREKDESQVLDLLDDYLDSADPDFDKTSSMNEDDFASKINHTNSLIGKIASSEVVTDFSDFSATGDITESLVSTTSTLKELPFLSQLEIKEAMRKLSPILNSLYRAESMGGEGNVEFKFGVSADGHVMNIFLVYDELNDYAFASLMLDRLKKITFPIKKKPSEFSYNFFFKL